MRGSSGMLVTVSVGEFCQTFRRFHSLISMDLEFGDPNVAILEAELSEGFPLPPMFFALEGQRALSQRTC